MDNIITFANSMGYLWSSHEYCISVFSLYLVFCNLLSLCLSVTHWLFAYHFYMTYPFQNRWKKSSSIQIHQRSVSSTVFRNKIPARGIIPIRHQNDTIIAVHKEKQQNREPISIWGVIIAKMLFQFLLSFSEFASVSWMELCYSCSISIMRFWIYFY